MKVRGGGRRLFLLGVMVLAGLALLAPGGAAAANVVNGNFETGTLAGWQVHRELEAGDWFAYSGSGEPISEKRADGPIQAPPQGKYAAIADEINPDSLILSQDIALGAGLSHRLSLLAYYDSYVPIAVPTPDSLSVDDEVLTGQANQQYRIDVMRPAAPIDSVDPADVLLTVFQTRPGDPKTMSPTRLTADLSPFAGQTVRLRITVVAHEEVLAGGVDAVAVESAPAGQLPPLGKKPGGGSNGPNGPRADLFSFGKAKANPKHGTATLPVRVSGPGLLKADGQGAPVATAGAAKGKKPAKLIKPTQVRAKAEGTVKLQLKPTPAALTILREKHKLRVRVAVTFEPSGGKPETATVPVVLKLEAAPKRPELPDAAERSRTFTGSRPHGPEPCASTSSATAAGERAIYRLRPQRRPAPKKRPQTRNR
jgi:hypothetical protein